MDRKELTRRLEKIGLNQKEFAELVGYSHQTIKQWKDEKIPKWVPILLDYFENIRQNELLAKKYILHPKKGAK